MNKVFTVFLFYLTFTIAALTVDAKFAYERIIKVNQMMKFSTAEINCASIRFKNVSNFDFVKSVRVGHYWFEFNMITGDIVYFSPLRKIGKAEFSLSEEKLLQKAKNYINIIDPKIDLERDFTVVTKGYSPIDNSHFNIKWSKTLGRYLYHTADKVLVTILKNGDFYSYRSSCFSQPCPINPIITKNKVTSVAENAIKELLNGKYDIRDYTSEVNDMMIVNNNTFLKNGTFDPNFSPKFNPKTRLAWILDIKIEYVPKSLKSFKALADFLGVKTDNCRVATFSAAIDAENGALIAGGNLFVNY